MSIVLAARKNATLSFLHLIIVLGRTDDSVRATRKPIVERSRCEFATDSEPVPVVFVVAKGAGEVEEYAAETGLCEVEFHMLAH
jgi:hypothetical protein